jgi:hypothetical protein
VLEGVQNCSTRSAHSSAENSGGERTAWSADDTGKRPGCGGDTKARSANGGSRWRRRRGLAVIQVTPTMGPRMLLLFALRIVHLRAPGIARR